jgi:hypothetical protein
MLSVAKKPIMLCVVMLNVIMLIVAAPGRDKRSNLLAHLKLRIKWSIVNTAPASYQ